MGEEIDEVLTLDQKRRELLQQTETMKAQRNAASKKIGEVKRNGESADAAIKETRELGDKIKELDQQIEANDEQLHDKMAHLPNIPHDGVPVSLTEEGAVELRKVGKIRDFDFEPKHHWDVGENLGILEASLGNSQVLPRDYFNQVEIETVIKEVGEQVAARLRHHHKLAGCLSLSIGFSYAAAEADGRGGFHQALKIKPTNDNQVLTQQLLWLFRQNWDGQAVRNIGVYSSKLSANSGQQLNLFETPRNQIRHSRLNQVIDEIHRQFGFTKLVYATSLLKGGTAIKRASLVGGHNGGKRIHRPLPLIDNVFQIS